MILLGTHASCSLAGLERCLVFSIDLRQCFHGQLLNSFEKTTGAIRGLGSMRLVIPSMSFSPNSAIVCLCVDIPVSTIWIISKSVLASNHKGRLRNLFCRFKEAPAHRSFRCSNYNLA